MSDNNDTTLTVEAVAISLFAGVNMNAASPELAPEVIPATKIPAAWRGLDDEEREAFRQQAKVQLEYLQEVFGGRTAFKPQQRLEGLKPHVYGPFYELPGVTAP